MKKKIKVLGVIIFVAAIMLMSTSCKEEEGTPKDAIPAVPTKVIATATSSNAIIISWNAVPQALQYYVYGSSTNSGDYNYIGVTPAENLYDTAYSFTATSYAIGSALYPVRTYYFKVSACNHLGESLQSDSVSARTLVPVSATTLSIDAWANGTLSLTYPETWYKFTASSPNQYIHLFTGSLNNVLVRLYDSSSEDVGSQSNLTGSTLYTSRSVTSGNEYFLRIISNGGEGSFKIAIGSSSAIPPITPPTYSTPLTADTWSNGSIYASSGEQWFKFTATANSQYIHFKPDTTAGTLSSVYIQLFDNAGTASGTMSTLNSGTLYAAKTVTSGNDYFIRVTPYTGGIGGTYKMTFSTSNLSPQ